MQTQDMISIKAKYQTEIRRFAIPVRSSFGTLESSVRSMFSVNGSMIIKFTDDEGDLCTITTQPELDFAVSMNPNLLRLQLFVSVDSAPVPTPVSTPISPGCQVPQQKFQRCLEHMEKKTARLSEKQASLTAQLAEATDPERKRVLACKLEKVQQKQAFFESRKQHFAQPHNQERPWKANGRGCWGRPNSQQEEKRTVPEKPFQPFPQDPQEREQRWIGFMEKRSQALSEKHESLTLKLSDDALTPERRKFLVEKLQRIQEKQSNLETRKQHLSQRDQEKNSHPCRGRGQRGGRFQDCPKIQKK